MSPPAHQRTTVDEMPRDEKRGWQIMATVCWWLSTSLGVIFLGLFAPLPHDGLLGHNITIFGAIVFAALLNPFIWIAITISMLRRRILIPTGWNKFMLASASLLVLTTATSLYDATR